ncbi:MAG: hypothetical protein BLM47_00390 [Candidatus Reconcilbacillus cellulovorans]|uniref:PhiEco32-like amidoligase-type 2 protein n=1 Tax=Candidatus Reconcilbacillus cellulovorans TaxID=1906605 RepID=A0A2A6E3R9_9BACL|nr:MAG: hypothetical protein BLM47_00390 [Candidatus Reconcilbacillus cellulovorans]
MEMTTYVWIRRPHLSSRFTAALRVPFGSLPPKPPLHVGAAATTAVVEWDVRTPPTDDRLWRLSGVNAENRDAARAVEIWRLHGIPNVQPMDGEDFGHGRLRWRACWTVPVFHLQPIGVFRSDGLRPVETAARAEPDGPTVRKAARLAVRALYALGLDFGVVDVASDAGRLAVVRVGPPERFEPVELWAEAIAQFDASLKESFRPNGSVMLGADPEFVLVNERGRLVPGSRFVEKRGTVGCDAVRLKDGRFAFPLMELRPEPAVDPRGAVRSVRKALCAAARQIRDPSCRWLAGGMPVRKTPLGGHLHFGGVWLNSHLLRALDNFLALPLMLLEDEPSARRRPRYGALGDFRLKPYGFEYRTPASWLSSPRATKAAFALAKLLATGHWRLFERPLDDPELVADFYAGRKDRLYDVVEQLWVCLADLPGYADFESWLEPVRRMIRERRTWDGRADIRRLWRIPVDFPDVV